MTSARGRIGGTINKGWKPSKCIPGDAAARKSNHSNMLQVDVGILGCAWEHPVSEKPVRHIIDVGGHQVSAVLVS